MSQANILTEMFKKYKDNRDQDVSFPIKTSRTVQHLSDSLKSFLEDFRDQALIISTLCQVYNDLTPILESDDCYNFMVDYIQNTTTRMVDDKLISSSLLERDVKEFIQSEIKKTEDINFIKKFIPSRLSFLTTGKFAKKYAEDLKSLFLQTPRLLPRQTIDQLQAKKESAENILRSMEHAYAMADAISSQFAESWELDICKHDTSEDYICDRVIRVFLFTETYNRLATNDTSTNTNIISVLLSFLELCLI